MLGFFSRLEDRQEKIILTTLEGPWMRRELLIETNCNFFLVNICRTWLPGIAIRLLEGGYCTKPQSPTAVTRNLHFPSEKWANLARVTGLLQFFYLKNFNYLSFLQKPQ